jgi:hypothetical protein
MIRDHLALLTLAGQRLRSSLSPDYQHAIQRRLSDGSLNEWLLAERRRYITQVTELHRRTFAEAISRVSGIAEWLP